MAMNKIIQNHILFVVSCARKFSSKNNNIADLIQEGILGMETAILKYNINSNVKFLSYAVWYILQRIRKFVDSHSSVIYIPVNQKQAANKITRKMINSNIPLENMNLSTDELIEYQNIVNASNIESLNTMLPGVEHSDIEFIDTIEDNSMVDHINNKTVNKYINNLIKDCSQKEKEFINGYFGLNGYESTTMVKLADELKVKHQRISSIKQQVLKKLRKHLPEKSYNDLILALNS
jgi:RNA polymerase primary sigma factor